MPEKAAPAHELMPQHKLLPTKEAEEVIAHYRVSRHLIPRIRAKDPGLAGTGAKAGQMVGVTRLDGSTCYRLVV